MHKLYELKEKLMKELEDYSQNGKFSKEDVEAIKYITSSIDHICNIVADADEEYSMAMGGGSYDGGMRGSSYNYGSRSYTRGGKRDGSYAYARGRGRNAKRDSMGRYSSERGYSGAEEDFRMEIENLIEDAPNERVKQKMRELMQEM